MASKLLPPLERFFTVHVVKDRCTKLSEQMYHRALKLIRQYHRMSQVELADKLKLSKSFVSELENGHKKASLEVLERYAEFFRVPLSSLMLFAEKADADDFSERTRTFAADKILKILEWLEHTTDKDTISGNDR